MNYKFLLLYIVVPFLVVDLPVGIQNWLSLMDTLCI